MVKLNVELLRRVNNVEFGMKREVVRSNLGNLIGEFKKTKFSSILTDDFGFCHVFYNDKDECEAIEIFEEAEVIVDGKIIFPGTLENIKSVVGDLEEVDGCYISENKSVGVFAPSGKPESILLGMKGYYE